MYLLKKFAGACSGLIYKKGKTTPKEVRINLKVEAWLKHHMGEKLPQTTKNSTDQQNKLNFLSLSNPNQIFVAQTRARELTLLCVDRE
jgi:hypothetical protein